MTKPVSNFVWHDVMTTDTKAAEKFYTAVVGWKAEDSGMPNQAYTLFKVGSTVVGGLMAVPADAAAMGAKPAWMGHIGVDDVDAYAKKVKAAGGAIYREPSDIPMVGRFAVAGDPRGAGFILFQPNSTEAPTQPPDGTPGTFGWAELHAGNLNEAWDFYSKLFGWRKKDAMDSPAGLYQTFAIADDLARGGMMTKTAETPTPHWNYYVYVDGIDAAAARITKAGGKIIMGPHEVPGGQWIINAVDPQGAQFNLLSKGK